MNRNILNKKQVYNPYLPSYEYIPDGEPHVFGDRIYLFGSHDRFSGAEFCLNDYVCYSASLDHLESWRYEGVIYKKEQDPRNQGISEDVPKPKPGFWAKPGYRKDDLNRPGIHAMWAPDVVQGADGRYYLFYCLDYLPEIAVAVCSSPAGKYEYLGLVCHKDGIPLGRKEQDFIQFDPGVFRDEDGEIYLYSGNAPRQGQENRKKHSQVMKLEADMLTLKEEPRLLLPSIGESEGTGFEGHEFYEASSIRKIGNVYYLVYSSVNSHELCYAVSERPDCGFQYGGSIIDIGNVYLDGREEKDAVNPLGNTHGGIECVNGQWYVFYHRQSDRTYYSRQACAEKIMICGDGSILQTELTSCGLNNGPLAGEGRYPANICCHLTGKQGVTFSHPLQMCMDYPFLTQDVDDMEAGEENAREDEKNPIQYVANLTDGSTVGYKYFQCHRIKSIQVSIRGNGEGKLVVQTTTGEGGEVCGEIPIRQIMLDKWSYAEGMVEIPDGVKALYFTYKGNGRIDMKQFWLKLG